MPTPKKPAPKTDPNPNLESPPSPDKLVQIDDSEHVEPENPPVIGDYLADGDLDEPQNPNIIITEDNEIPPEFQKHSSLDEDADPNYTSGRVPDTQTSYPASYTETMNRMTAQERARQANTGQNFLPPQSALPDLRNVRYEGRVKVIEAWCFNGVITEAPPYVDRNWLAYGGYDEERKIQPGPMIQMPYVDNFGRAVGQPKNCRIGDYIVQQEIRLDHGQKSHVKVEVWPRDEFERVFIVVAADEPELALEAPKKNQGKAA